MVLSAAYEVFVKKVLRMRGFSPRTLESYRWSFQSFLNSVGDKPLSELNIEDFMKWRDDVARKNLDTNTIATCSYKLRMFIRWLSKNYDTPIDPEEIMVPKTKKRLPKFLSIEEVRELYDSCEDPRERVIVSILFTTGIRISELCAIRLNNIDGDKILIQGKGDKERYVFINEMVIEDIKEYIEWNPYKGSTLIMGYKGPMTRSGVGKVINDISKRSGLDKNITAHMLRHTFATTMLRNGCNIRHIQEMLGHADISTTQLYTHVTKMDIQQSFRKYHVAIA